MQVKCLQPCSHSTNNKDKWSTISIFYMQVSAQLSNRFMQAVIGDSQHRETAVLSTCPQKVQDPVWTSELNTGLSFRYCTTTKAISRKVTNVTCDFFPCHWISIKGVSSKGDGQNRAGKSCTMNTLSPATSLSSSYCSQPSAFSTEAIGIVQPRSQFPLRSAAWDVQGTGGEGHGGRKYHKKLWKVQGKGLSRAWGGRERGIISSLHPRRWLS